jgi:hypothetical protein
MQTSTSSLSLSTDLGSKSSCALAKHLLRVVVNHLLCNAAALPDTDERALCRHIALVDIAPRPMTSRETHVSATRRLRALLRQPVLDMTSRRSHSIPAAAQQHEQHITRRQCPIDFHSGGTFLDRSSPRLNASAASNDVVSPTSANHVTVFATFQRPGRQCWELAVGALRPTSPATCDQF